MQNHPIPRHPRPRLVGALVALAGAALLLLPARTLAQCPDPAVPQGGFALNTSGMNQPVTYGDGGKTAMDVRYPTAKPGSCGWPVIIVGQGFGGTRSGPRKYAERLAKRGYMTVTYDVRGIGAGNNSSTPGCEFLGRSELLDLAEIVRLIDKTYGKTGTRIADVSRLGITGFSYGGGQSWKAAAWSGRALPTTNNRGIKTFPVFKAAYPIDAIPYASDWWVLGGTALFSGAVSTFKSPGQVKFEPGFLAKVTKAFSSYNAAAFAAIWTNDPWRQDLAHLKSSIVPVMAHLQWGYAEKGVSALDAMPKTTPTRAFLSVSSGHGYASNLRQSSQKHLFAQRWFDRFLKGIKNQVDTEPRFVTGVMSETDALYRNPNTLLRHRYSATWGPAGTNLLKYYLRRNKVLSTQAPTTAEPPETITHVVNSGWTWTGFVNQGGDASLITAAFGYDSTYYDTVTQNKPLEIVGSPRVMLEVSPQASATDYQLHCALYQVPASGKERFLQSGVAAVKGNSKAQRLTVDFFDIHVYVPKGDKLRLKIENVSRWYLAGLPSGVFTYYTIPFFKNAVVDIEHTAARRSWFEIPVAKTIQPSLTSATLEIDTFVPADVVFHVEGTPGADYLLAFGISGISPGVVLPGGATALLNVDAVTDGLLALTNTAFLPKTLGKLNAAGNAIPQPRIALGGFPALGSFVGLRLNVLAVLRSNNQLSASNPLDLFFR